MKQVIGRNKEIVTIEQHLINSGETRGNTTFTYKLNDKAAKSKLLRAASRPPIDMEENSTSTNLVFSAGAWIHAVLPALRY